MTRDAAVQNNRLTREGLVVRREQQSPRFRRDIQGLRMLAVLAVILDHLVAWPKGGFVGVDVFFVISGFLITGLLIREYEQTGEISFKGFYRRRIKRILPAAIATLLVTMAAAFAFLTPANSKQTAWDAVYALFFSANWNFALAGTDYFQADEAPSPLQHFWTLSVEEQFYFVWPLLIVGILALTAARRRGGHTRKITGALMALIIAASFAWAMFESVSSPTIAYFSTFTRAWELGLGALLAIASPLWIRMPSWVRPVLGWLGLVGIIASFSFISDDLPFPGPWAALPVVAAGLVIIGGTGGDQRLLWPLTSRPSAFVGAISYSLYLWHFPVIIIGGAVLGTNPWVFFPVTVSLIVVLSITSYYLIEEPLMKSPWLEGGRRSFKQRMWRAWRQSFAKRMRYGWLGALALTVGCLVAVGVGTTQQVVPESPSFAVPTASASDDSGAAQTPASLEHAAVEEAAAAQAFPALSPAVSELGLSGWSDTLRATACLDVDAENISTCTYGPTDTGKDVVIFGDSFAMAWLPGVRSGLEAEGWRVHQITRGECPSINVEVTHSDGTSYPECAAWRAWALDQIDAIRPELTILASADTTIDRLATSTSPDGVRSVIQTGTEAVIARTNASSGRTVVLAAPPLGKSLRACAVPGATPADCTTKPDYPWTALDDGQKAAAQASNVEHIDTRSWFCSSRGVCPAFVGTTPVRTDGTHLTIEFSTLLGPVLKEALLEGPISSTDPSDPVR